jgi:hypothetical protein
VALTLLVAVLFRLLWLFFPARRLVRPTHVGPSDNRVPYIGPPMERVELERMVQQDLASIPGR